VGELKVKFVGPNSENLREPEEPINPRLWSTLMHLEATQAMCTFVSLSLELDLLESDELCQTYLYLDYLEHKELDELEKLLCLRLVPDPTKVSHGSSLFLFLFLLTNL
jgi:hypothetical protein